MFSVFMQLQRSNMVFQCINIRQVAWEVLKTAACGLGFQHLHGIWRVLMHEKPCLIPILLHAVYSYYNRIIPTPNLFTHFTPFDWLKETFYTV